MGFAKDTLSLIISVLWLAILASVIISWLRLFGVRVPYYHPVVKIIEETADLILKPIRRHVPTTGGGIDFSPFIALLLLEIARRIINQVL
jgi:YggT family protein